MCGINGIFTSKIDEKILKESIQSMNSLIAHRGPDGNGYFVKNQIALGHTRLAIIDLKQTANQPMFSLDQRYCIVFNGEIYNYQALKKSIENEYFFTTNSDTEVILALFQKYGISCLDMLDGMFAFCIYDSIENDFILARDRFGVKPLYYHKSEEIFVFSSEIRPIIHFLKHKVTVDISSMASFYRNQTVFAPNTMLNELAFMDSGTWLRFKDNVITKGVFYDFKTQYIDAVSKPIKNNTKEIKKEISTLFYQAIEKRLVSDVTFGAFLSGGIDSTAVVGAMSKLHSQKINTYSVVFEEQAYSEAKYAQLASKMFGTNHHEIKINPQDLLDVIPDAFASMDFPTVDGINTYLVSKLTRETGVKMVLSGIGGDELFAGYPSFKTLSRLTKNKWFYALPSSLRKQLLLILFKENSTANKKRIELLSLPNFDLPNIHNSFRSLFSNDELNTLLQQNSKIMSLELLIEPNHILTALSYLENTRYLQPILLRDTDQMSMAHALEVREPFLDTALIEYVFSIQDSVKFPYTPKKLFVDSLPELLSDDIVHRPKMGFVLPWEHWLRNELREFTEKNIIQLSRRSYFNEQEILKKWKDFCKNEHSITWSRIWSFVVMEQWLSKNGVE